ncbi:MAG TPA: NAD(P)/FAD-dependent oxidoreductase [Steroidobacteraceae bacterium]|nr:NAD(P)/FAD-dependent oxidoreductase [Steroidobacteraceae bacterium]
MSTPLRVEVIGGGIAGLCTAVLARRCGYDVEVLEQHESAGGLATSWRRGGYTFENCLHWLLGANPRGPMHAQWAEVFAIDQLRFVHPEEYVRLEDARGEQLIIPTNVERLESQLLRCSPADAREIRHLASAIRKLAAVTLPDPAQSGIQHWLATLRNAAALPTLRHWSAITCADYARRFKHPLLRRFFGEGELAELSALALVFSMAWMSEHDAAYVIGGSRAIIELIVRRLHELGGRLRLGAPVKRILVEGDAVVGVRLASGESIDADWVVSAADGHATLEHLLGGLYTDTETEERYRRLRPFPSYVMVSLGVAEDLSGQAALVTHVLDSPLQVDPGTQLSQLSVRFFHFDPTFAPAGKTAVTCLLPTRNDAYWLELRQQRPERYRAEKQRIAAAVIAVLGERLPTLPGHIEVTDVATPATIMRYTGNWHGSMEGWLLTPGIGFRPLRHTLPGLDRFVMAGHWVMPGGGLPSGLMTARRAVQEMCRRDGRAFPPGQDADSLGRAVVSSASASTPVG